MSIEKFVLVVENINKDPINVYIMGVFNNIFAAKKRFCNGEHILNQFIDCNEKHAIIDKPIKGDDFDIQFEKSDKTLVSHLEWSEDEHQINLKIYKIKYNENKFIFTESEFGKTLANKLPIGSFGYLVMNDAIEKAKIIEINEACANEYVEFKVILTHGFDAEQDIKYTGLIYKNQVKRTNFFATFDEALKKINKKYKKIYFVDENGQYFKIKLVDILKED